MLGPFSHPFSGHSCSAIHPSPRQAFGVDVTAIISPRFLSYALLPCSHVDLISVPIPVTVRVHVAFAHRCPPPGAAPLPSLFVQILLILEPR